MTYFKELQVWMMYSEKKIGINDGIQPKSYQTFCLISMMEKGYGLWVLTLISKMFSKILLNWIDRVGSQVELSIYLQVHEYFILSEKIIEKYLLRQVLEFQSYSSRKLPINFRIFSSFILPSYNTRIPPFASSGDFLFKNELNYRVNINLMILFLLRKYLNDRTNL